MLQQVYTGSSYHAKLSLLDTATHMRHIYVDIAPHLLKDHRTAWLSFSCPFEYQSSDSTLKGSLAILDHSVTRISI